MPKVYVRDKPLKTMPGIHTKEMTVKCRSRSEARAESREGSHHQCLVSERTWECRGTVLLSRPWSDPKKETIMNKWRKNVREVYFNPTRLSLATTDSFYRSRSDKACTQNFCLLYGCWIAWDTKGTQRREWFILPLRTEEMLLKR